MVVFFQQRFQRFDRPLFVQWVVFPAESHVEEPHQFVQSRRLHTDAVRSTSRHSAVTTVVILQYSLRYRYFIEWSRYSARSDVCVCVGGWVRMCVYVRTKTFDRNYVWPRQLAGWFKVKFKCKVIGQSEQSLGEKCFCMDEKMQKWNAVCPTLTPKVTSGATIPQEWHVLTSDYTVLPASHKLIHERNEPTCIHFVSIHQMAPLEQGNAHLDQLTTHLSTLKRWKAEFA